MQFVYVQANMHSIFFVHVHIIFHRTNESYDTGFEVPSVCWSDIY